MGLLNFFTKEETHSLSGTIVRVGVWSPPTEGASVMHLLLAEYPEDIFTGVNWMRGKDILFAQPGDLVNFESTGDNKIKDGSLVNKTLRADLARLQGRPAPT